MGADFSRVRFNALHDYAGVELGQGRVLLDADANELMAIVDRRSRALASDENGRVWVSSTTPDAFKISAVGGTLQIGKGRLYVDGLLAENHGEVSTDPAKRVFDDLLAETQFADPVSYAAQPYLPEPPPLPPSGRHLVYLDVWNREVTHLEQPDLIESAVGVDTSSRLQTVWQVRVLDDDAGTGTCASPDADLPGWSAIIAPSTGVLSTGTFDVAPADDPCELPPTGGYRGLENQLYRVQIHNAGQPGADATFKWSRENASVCSRVVSMISDAELELETLGRDDVLRFSAGDWVEVIDDVSEFSQAAGAMARITTIDEATRRIQFTPPLVPPTLPGSFPNSAFPLGRHMRVCRWDQSGAVFRTDSSGTPVQVQDLDAAGSPGVIDVAAEGTTLLLENGVTVSFASTVANGKGFRAGDYWVFAARTADASVEILDRAPPRGIPHHYARLAMLDTTGTTPIVDDCRPGSTDQVGGCCNVVRPGENIQAAIDGLPPEGGCVCLKAGLHEIAAPLVIARENVSLHGESLGAIVRSQAGGALLNIGGRGIRVSTITFVQSEAPAATVPMISVLGTDGLVIHDCQLQSRVGNATGIGLFIQTVENATIEDCSLEGCGMGIWLNGRCENVLIAGNDIDIAAPAGNTPVTVGVLARGPTAPIAVERNRIAGAVSGVVINDAPAGQPKSLAEGSRVVDNRIDVVASAATGEFAFVYGIDVAAARSVVSGNQVTDRSISGHVGIRVAGDASIVQHNIVSTATLEGPNRGIVVGFGDGTDFLPLERVIVTGNQLQGREHGVFVLGAARCVFSDNELRGGGFFLINADDCHINGNVLTGPLVTGVLLGIQLHGGARNHILGNTIDRGIAGVLLSNETGPMISGNRVTGVSTGGIMVHDIEENCHIVENRLTNCGHGKDPAVGIEALRVFGELHIEANEVMNTGVPLDPQQPAAATAWGIGAQLILEARVESNLISYSDENPRPPTAEDRALRMQGLIENIFGPRNVTGFPVQIAGNKFIGTGATALVELREERISPSQLIRFERVLFSGNYCSHFSGPVSAEAATVSLVGRHCTVSGNQVKAITPDFPSYHFHDMLGPFIGNVSHAGNLGRAQPFPAPELNFNQRSPP